MQLRVAPFVLEVLYLKMMTKRKLFAELTEGFDALAAARSKCKKTLRTTEESLKSALEVGSDELHAIREIAPKRTKTQQLPRFLNNYQKLIPFVLK